MIDARLIWALLIAAQAIINAPALLYLLKERMLPVTVSPQAQAIVDALNGASTNLPTALASASGAASAQASEDLAAIKTAADTLVSAIAAAVPAPAEAVPEEDQVSQQQAEQ